MVKKRSRAHRNNNGGGGGGNGGGVNRRRCFVQATVGVLVLYVLSCGGAAASLGDRSLVYAAAAAAADGTAARNGRSAANLSHITGTARKIKMFVKNRYLQVFPDGTVNSTAEDTSDYVILQRTSVNMGQLKIQGVATCMYLCMDACGLLYGSKDFEDECVFNEMIEQDHYNTYSSAKYTNERRALYLALNKRGTPRKVQVKAGASLGKLSAYARVLTQSVPAQRVEQLLAGRRPLSSSSEEGERPHGHRHHHACPAHAGPPRPTAAVKRRNKPGGRWKCHAKGGAPRKKSGGRDDAERDGGGDGKEDEDCCGAARKTGDEVGHRKADAAGRKMKSKRPRRPVKEVKAKKSEDASPPPPPQQQQQQLVVDVVVDEDDDGGGDDDDRLAHATAATASTDEFLDSNDN